MIKQHAINATNIINLTQFQCSASYTLQVVKPTVKPAHSQVHTRKVVFAKMVTALIYLLKPAKQTLLVRTASNSVHMVYQHNVLNVPKVIFLLVPLGNVSLLVLLLTVQNAIREVMAFVRNVRMAFIGVAIGIVSSVQWPTVICVMIRLLVISVHLDFRLMPLTRSVNRLFVR